MCSQVSVLLSSTGCSFPTTSPGEEVAAVRGAAVVVEVRRACEADPPVHPATSAPARTTSAHRARTTSSLLGSAQPAHPVGQCPPELLRVLLGHEVPGGHGDLGQRGPASHD